MKHDRPPRMHSSWKQRKSLPCNDPKHEQTYLSNVPLFWGPANSPFSRWAPCKYTLNGVVYLYVCWTRHDACMARHSFFKTFCVTAQAIMEGHQPRTSPRVTWKSWDNESRISMKLYLEAVNIKTRSPNLLSQNENLLKALSSWLILARRKMEFLSRQAPSPLRLRAFGAFLDSMNEMLVPFPNLKCGLVWMYWARSWCESDEMTFSYIDKNNNNNKREISRRVCNANE